MRTLLIGALAAMLVGCSQPLAPQASMEACADPNGFGGLNKVAAGRPLEPAPASPKTSSAAIKVKSTIAARAQERSTAAGVRDRPQPAEKNSPSTGIEAKAEAPASSAETSDPVLVKAKTTMAAKLEKPASAEFIEINRAIRKDMAGQPVDTICGRVKARNTSGEEAAIWPFLYFVKKDTGFVVYGPAGSAAETAYRNICIEPGKTGQPPGSVATDRKVPSM